MNKDNKKLTELYHVIQEAFEPDDIAKYYDHLGYMFVGFDPSGMYFDRIVTHQVPTDDPSAMVRDGIIDQEELDVLEYEFIKINPI